LPNPSGQMEGMVVGFPGDPISLLPVFVKLFSKKFAGVADNRTVVRSKSATVMRRCLVFSLLYAGVAERPNAPA
jgi:hypothetical protein